MDALDTIKMVKRDPYGVALRAGQALNQLVGAESHDVAMILGSGYEDFPSALGSPSFDIPATDVVGFMASGVEGHAGRIQSICFEGKRVLVLPRKHLYEVDEEGDNLPISVTVHAVRTAVAAGCKQIILTNAVGGLHPEWPNGKAVIAKDVFTRFVPSPIPGPNFVQCADVFSKRLRDLCVAVELDLEEGNYIQVMGPHFEPRFEAQIFREWHLDHVGMSLGTEAVAAIDPKASPKGEVTEVLAISVISDLAGDPTSHHDVLKVVRRTARELAPKIPLLIRRM